MKVDDLRFYVDYWTEPDSLCRWASRAAYPDGGGEPVSSGTSASMDEARRDEFKARQAWIAGRLDSRPAGG